LFVGDGHGLIVLDVILRVKSDREKRQVGSRKKSNGAGDLLPDRCTI
jgi:hypothetical protein